MAHKTLIGGTAYEISGGKTLVNGTAYSIKNGKTLVGGTAYEVAFSKPLEEYAIGDMVSLNVDGASTKFLVIHQGLPSDMYDSSCNGTWLMTRDIYISASMQADIYDDPKYALSLVHSYLNNTFINLFDSNIRNIIKTVKIPYMDGTRQSSSLLSGSNGLSTKAFILSFTEVGYVDSRDIHGVEGATVDYFKNADDSDRIAYMNGAKTEWWLRSPRKVTGNTGYPYILSVDEFGRSYYSWSHQRQGVRPVIILPSYFII
jgi:hypothetical protein